MNCIKVKGIFIKKLKIQTLKSHMVIAPSIPVVQNLRQSLLSPSYIDTWLQSKNNFLTVHNYKNKQ